MPARGLALHYHAPAFPRASRAGTPTFIPPQALKMPGYGLSASPMLYPGQVVRAVVEADAHNPGPITAGLFLRHYGAADALVPVAGSSAQLTPGAHHQFAWRLDDPAAAPIAGVGVRLSSAVRTDGIVYLNYLAWDGSPDIVFQRPAHDGTLWRRAWVNPLEHFEPHFPETFRLVQDEGTGLLLTGSRDWTDYEVSATITPHLLASDGIAARVQGLRRYYALLAGSDQRLRLVKTLDVERVFAAADLAVGWGRVHDLRLRVSGRRLMAYVDGHLLFDDEDTATPLTDGRISPVVGVAETTRGCIFKLRPHFQPSTPTRPYSHTVPR